jgi:hypothetical protein
MRAAVDQLSMNSLRGKRAALVLALLTATFAALSSAATAAAAGGGPQLAFQPAGHDFGLQQVYSVTQAGLQLRNEGEAPAPIYSLETSGADAGSFSIGGSDCYGRTLEPGESCSMQVYFNPNEMRSYEASVRAGSEGGANFTASLSGRGGRSIFTPATDPTNFGAVAVGAPAVTRTIDVTNTGNMPGGVFIAVISGGAVGSFHLLDENCTGTLLSPAATCNAVVSFLPISTGAKTARLSLFGESDGGTQITLTGVGLEPETSVPDTSQAAVFPQAQTHQKRRADPRPRRHRALKRGRRGRAGLARRRAIS